MFSNCVKLKNRTLDNVSSLEKWLFKKCTCSGCKKSYNHINNIIDNTTIEKNNTLIHDNLLLTSKMIIKIQTEIAKKHILSM